MTFQGILLFLLFLDTFRKGWKIRRLEDWKVRMLEGWKIGCYESAYFPNDYSITYYIVFKGFGRF